MTIDSNYAQVIALGLCCLVPALAFLIAIWWRGQSSGGGQPADWIPSNPEQYAPIVEVSLTPQQRADDWVSDFLKGIEPVVRIRHVTGPLKP